MTTGDFSNWTGDISQIGAIYPFVGSEFILVILGVVFWIGWHFLQISGEAEEYSHDTQKMQDKEKIRDFIGEK